MLIDVGQSGEDRQGVIRSIVRLHDFEKHLGGAADISGLGVDDRLLFTGGDDRELSSRSSFVPGVCAIGDNELSGQMIECGAKVMDYISRHNAKTDGWWRLDIESPRQSGASALLRNMLFELPDDAVRVTSHIPGDSYTEFMGVLPCS